MGPIISRMTRGFQIWPHNSNQIIFDLFLPKNYRKLAKSGAHFYYFVSFLLLYFFDYFFWLPVLRSHGRFHELDKLVGERFDSQACSHVQDANWITSGRSYYFFRPRKHYHLLRFGDSPWTWNTSVFKYLWFTLFLCWHLGWRPLVIFYMIGPHLTGLTIFFFLILHAFSKNIKSRVRSTFSKTIFLSSQLFMALVEPTVFALS